MTYVRGINDLVCGRICKDGLSMDTCFVGKGGETSDVVVEGDVDLDAVGDQILDLLEHLQLVLGLDIVTVGNDHPCHQATQRGDAVPFANADDGCVDVSCTGLECAVCVGDCAARVVVEMAFDVAADDSAKCSYEVVDLSGACAADGVCNTDSVHTNLVDSTVESKEIDQV